MLVINSRLTIVTTAVINIGCDISVWNEDIHWMRRILYTTLKRRTSNVSLRRHKPPPQNLLAPRYVVFKSARPPNVHPHSRISYIVVSATVFRDKITH